MVIPSRYVEIVCRVAEAHGFAVEDLKPGDNHRSVHRARVAVWQALRDAGASYPECARATGHWAHGSVIKALQRAGKERAA